MATKVQAFQVVHPNASGIDIGSSEHWVGIGSTNSVKAFGTFTSDLYKIVDYLREHNVTTVAMEATGVYWIPLYELLAEQGFDVCLADARQLKATPGRKKTDVCDSQWLARLHSYGLLKAAFRPEEAVCQLRCYLRQRCQIVSQQARSVQHMQKALEQMNIKLDNVLRDITGKTGMLIIRSILQGQRDSKILAEHRDPRCKNDQQTIALSLQGNWREEHLFALKMAVESYDFYQKQIEACDKQIEACLKQFNMRTSEPCPATSKAKRSQQSQGNAPRFEVRELLFGLLGVDLTQIPGMNAYSALQLVAEIGFDVDSFASSKQFASWLGLCPNNKVSGGRCLSSRTKMRKGRAAMILRACANALHRSKCSLGQYLRTKKAHLGAPGAITATAHKLARILWHMIKHREPYQERSQEESQYKELCKLTRRAQALGHKLVPIASP